MTVLGFSLLLVAAFSHAIWNVFVKRINGGPELVWLFSAVAIVIYLPVAGFIFVTEKPDLGYREIGFIVGSTVLHLRISALATGLPQRRSVIGLSDGARVGAVSIDDVRGCCPG